TSNLANTRFERGDADGARRLLIDLLSVMPDSLVARVNLATIERRRGDLLESLRQSDLVWRQEPEGPTAIAGLAMSLSALERLDEATTLMQRLPPGSPARHALALRLLLQADPAAALPLEISARVDQ